MIMGMVCVILGLANLGFLAVNRQLWWSGVAGGFALGVGIMKLAITMS